MDRNRDKRGVSMDFKDNLCESRPLPRDTGLQFWQYIRNLPGEKGAPGTRERVRAARSAPRSGLEP